MKPILITADWHLRKDVPRCRAIPEGDWIDYQLQRVWSIMCIAEERGADVLLAGDIFNNARAGSDQLVSGLLNALFSFRDVRVGILPGNHDLLYHSMDYINRSTLGQLWQIALAGRTNLVPAWELEGVCGAPFGVDDSLGQGDIRVLHALTFPRDKDIPGYIEDAESGESLLEKYQEKIIVTGDYHGAWDIKEEGRRVINPGCLAIQAADMEDYTPGVYLLSSMEEAPEWVACPEDGDTISREFLDQETERDERIQAFIEGLSRESGVTLDFKANLDKAVAGLKGKKKRVVENLLQDWRKV